MSEYISITLLALLQGITEFLPISSSGHLLLAGELLGFKSPGVTLEVFLHFGTLIALVVFYRRKIWGLIQGALRSDAPSWRYILNILIAIVPAALLYVAFGKHIKAIFEKAEIVGPLLILTGLYLLLLRLLPRRPPSAPLSSRNAFWVGIAQAVALLPGVSRSGSTIATARLLNIAPEEAAEFSFMAGLPLMAGATLLECRHLASEGLEGFSLLGLLLGIAIAAVTGYIALVLLVRLLRHGAFWMFGIYCLAVGAAASLWLLL